MHPAAFDMAYIRDPRDRKFATRRDNIFILGEGSKAAITLPKSKGVKYTIIEDREHRLKKQATIKHGQNQKKALVGKGTVLPPKVKLLREQTKEKKKLLKLLKQQDAKSGKNKPKVKKAKKKPKKEEAAA